METPALVERLRARIGSGESEPVAQLIVDDLWLAVVDGSLDVGQRLPTVRHLAIGLGVSPRTVERAYRELEERGVVVTRPGSGSFVSLSQPSDQDRSRRRELGRVSREAAERAAELGFTIDDLLESLADVRAAQDETRTQEPRT